MTAETGSGFSLFSLFYLEPAYLLQELQHGALHLLHTQTTESYE